MPGALPDVGGWRGIPVRSEPEALPAQALRPPVFCVEPQGGESSTIGAGRQLEELHEQRP